MTGHESLCEGTFQIVSQPVSGMPERIVTAYDTREEADEALAWYARTYSPPAGSLWVREVPTDG